MWWIAGRPPEKIRIVWSSLRGSPDNSVHGGSTHHAVCDRHDALQRLRLHEEAVAGRPEAVPVEDVDGAIAGATDRLPTTLGEEEEVNEAMYMIRRIRAR